MMNKLIITKKDIFKIISDAKMNIVNFNLPLFIDRQEVEANELVGLAYLESVLMFLNARNLLNEIPRINFTDPTAEHDQELPLEDE